MSSFLTKVIKNSLMKKPYLSALKYTTVKNTNLWEPDYLILAKLKPPEYELINFQIKSYDFVILEKYQSLIHKIANKMDLDVSNCWATPCQDLKINTIKPKSGKVENEYTLHLYERNVQVADVKAHLLPLLIDLVVTACPPGVNLSVHDHTPEMEEVRYVPDVEIIELEGKLEELKQPKKK